MTLTNLQSLRYFAPEIVLSLAIVAVLVADKVTRGQRRGVNAGVACAGLLAAFGAGLLQLGTPPVGLFGGMLVLDPFGIFFKLFFIAVTFLVVLIVHPYRELSEKYHGEAYTMMLGTVLGMSLLATSNNLLMIYLALEMTSLPSYLLTSVLRRDAKASEAGLKYVLFGAAASGASSPRDVLCQLPDLLHGLEVQGQQRQRPHPRFQAEGGGRRAPVHLRDRLQDPRGQLGRPRLRAARLPGCDDGRQGR